MPVRFRATITHTHSLAHNSFDYMGIIVFSGIESLIALLAECKLFSFMNPWKQKLYMERIIMNLSFTLMGSLLTFSEKILVISIYH